MKNIGLNEIRSEFLDFFEEKDHLRLESYSLIPKDDDSLLLINAGMAPLKAYFTGDKRMSKNRATSSQKCIRTADIERVGKTARHGTFFEMLGNFSFGDYFKKEAIEWAWEFLTKRMEIPEEKLWVSVYVEDDEAYRIWNEEVGVPEGRIVRLGKEDNFWELEVGPCGPCSEIHYDRGPSFGCDDPDCKPGCDCDRFMEIWNLVFTQFNKLKSGEYIPLASPNIDTGMGLERIALVLEGVSNIFELKLIKKIIAEIEKISGKKYNDNQNDDVSIRIISDHTRAMVFLIGDGVVPSNEGRGYVLRRIIRRAIRHGILLGIRGEFLLSLADTVINAYREEYEILDRDRQRIYKIISAEEDKFSETIESGLKRLEQIIQLATQGENKVIDGVEVFRLYDTYGFPLDLTREIAEERGLTVDEEMFQREMDIQRTRSREGRMDSSGWVQSEGFLNEELEQTEFDGYRLLQEASTIVDLYQDDHSRESIKEGKGIIVLKNTPFYAESGGQVGDTGLIRSESGVAKVLDTKNSNGITLHMVEITEGSFKVKDSVHAVVDPERRQDIMRNHSATHLLHKALKEVLGPHVNQAGSYVDHKRLRFDFTHYESLSQEQLDKVEDLVNQQILASLEVSVDEMGMADATKKGAVGLFEDRYGDVVRVVSMGDYSMELCGGTHVHNTSNIGLFKILQESSVATGIRRIEAITGPEVYRYLLKLDRTIKEVSHVLKSGPKEIVQKTRQLVDTLKSSEKEIENLKIKSKSSQIDDILKGKADIEGITVVTHSFKDSDIETLRVVADQIRDRNEHSVIVFSNETESKVTFMAMVSKELVTRGLHAGNLIREVAKITGGNGGGRPDFASAGGKDGSKIPDALAYVSDYVEENIK